MRRYVIIGVGAIGGTIGGRLAQHGIPVVWVARGDHGAALSARGMRLLTPEGEVRAAAPVVSGPDDLAISPDDVFVLATKTQDAEAALATWADVPVIDAGRQLGRAGDLLPVLTALNGVAGEEIALRYVRRVFGVCVWAPCTYQEPGVIVARMTPVSAVLHVGRYPATLRDDEDAQLLGDLARDWTAAGLTVYLPADVMAWKYRKLVSNAANAVEALVGLGEEKEEFVRAAMREADAVCTTVGVPMTPLAEERALRRSGPQVAEVPGAPVVMGGSSWQSLARGAGSIETDFLSGEIVCLAHRAGLTAPVNATLARLCREAIVRGAGGGRPYLSAAELRAELEPGP